MNIQQLGKAQAQAAHLEELKSDRADLEKEWDRLIGLMRDPNHMAKVPIKIGTGSVFDHLRDGHWEHVTVRMTKATFNFILAELDQEITDAKIVLEEMGVEVD